MTESLTQKEATQLANALGSAAEEAWEKEMEKPLTQKPFEKLNQMFRKEGFSPAEIPERQHKRRKKMHKHTTEQRSANTSHNRPPDMPLIPNAIPMQSVTPFKRIATEAFIKATIYTAVPAIVLSLVTIIGRRGSNPLEVKVIKE